jgi:hypothetical protein
MTSKSRDESLFTLTAVPQQRPSLIPDVDVSPEPALYPKTCIALLHDIVHERVNPNISHFSVAVATYTSWKT